MAWTILRQKEQLLQFDEFAKMSQLLLQLSFVPPTNRSMQETACFLVPIPRQEAQNRSGGTQHCTATPGGTEVPIDEFGVFSEWELLFRHSVLQEQVHHPLYCAQ